MLNIDVSQLFESEAERQAYQAAAVIDKIMVAHPDAVSALNGIRHCIKSSVYSREPMGCMLLGAGGMGKTMLAEHIMRSLPQQTVIADDCEIDTTPSFYVSFKKAENLSDLTTEMLDRLNDLRARVGKPAARARRVRKLLLQCKTLIVFIDEMHDLRGLKKRDPRRVEEFLGWIKELSNERSLVLCLMGEPSCHDIFGGDDSNQMSRRFKAQFMLNPLTPGTKDQTGHLLPFLAEVGKQVLQRTPIQSLPPIHSYENALRFFAAAGGNLDFTMVLIKQAVITALKAGRTVVTMADFSDLWGAGITSKVSLVRLNPFDATDGQVAAAFRGRA
ncbi:TniB family NTP-binding protein [Chitinolyticbacter meiyuanensis]|uniref:TniB family NTP-binding protein n=1 Tax=Chitinolyticbacter meiyuanensis TaxID=682798 RepID=UPI0011E5CD3A|nr:TniB family NTP-binding protein [Chitinolyticbacter meiyuanensis]